MGIFDWFRGEKKAAKPAAGYPSFQIINGQWVGIDDNKGSYITNGYTINDQLYSIVNLILDKIRLPEWGTYKIKDEQKFKAYQGLMRKKGLTGEDYKTLLHLKEQSLEPVSAGKLTELLKYPNEYQSMQDMMTALIGYKLLTGDYYQYNELLDAGANQGQPFAFHALPSQDVTIIADRTRFPLIEAGYNIASIQANFQKSQVLHGKYWNPGFDANGSHLYGLSPVKSALKRLTRNNSALKASGAMYQNQGVKGVLYIDDPRVLQNGVSPADTKKQMDAVKGTLAGEWTGEDNFGKIGTSGYKMGWQEMGLSPVDLNIIEAEKWDYIGLCNIYGVPPELLGLTAKTYNNVKEAESALTSRVAMPQLVSYRDELNRYLQTYTAQKNKGIIVDFDQTCFTELQEDLAAKWGWIKELPISPNSKLMQMGMETNEAKEFDEVWITPAMGMPLSEWQMQDDGQDNATGI